MRSQRIGRALGIGIRVAGRIAGQRLAGQSHSGAHRIQAGPANVTVSAGGATADSAPHARTIGQTAGQAATRAGGGLSQGLGGFFRPFRRVGGNPLARGDRRLLSASRRSSFLRIFGERPAYSHTPITERSGLQRSSLQFFSIWELVLSGERGTAHGGLSQPAIPSLLQSRKVPSDPSVSKASPSKRHESDVCGDSRRSRVASCA